MSRKRQRQNRQRRRVIAQLVAERGELCEAKLEGICTGRAGDAHEILTRARQGSITDGTNILLLCRECHDWVTLHPVGAAERGLMAWSWDGGQA